MTKPIEITKEAEAIATREIECENAREFWGGCERRNEEPPKGYWVQVALNSEREKALREAAEIVIRVTCIPAGARNPRALRLLARPQTVRGGEMKTSADEYIVEKYDAHSYGWPLPPGLSYEWSRVRTFTNKEDAQWFAQHQRIIKGRIVRVVKRTTTIEL